MAIGYLLISTAPLKKEEVGESLRGVEGIAEIYKLNETGYDFIAKIECDDFNQISETAYEVRSIKGVVDVKTLAGIKL